MLKTIRRVTTNNFYDNFRHPKLSIEELRLGCKLGLDSWADTGCSGKHARVEEFCIWKTRTATGFSSSLGKLDNLPYAHVWNAYSYEEGSVVLIEHNNTTYMDDGMNDRLSNPKQSEESGVIEHLRPIHYYNNDDHAQTISFPDGTIIPIVYDDDLPFIPIRRQIENCRRLQLTSKDDLDPYHLRHRLAVMSTRQAPFQTLPQHILIQSH